MNSTPQCDNLMFTPPLYTFTGHGDTFDNINDFDIGLLSEYLLDDEIPQYSTQKFPLKSFSVDTENNKTNDFASLAFMNEGETEEGYSSHEDSDSKKLKSERSDPTGDEKSADQDLMIDDDNDQIGKRRERNRVLARKTRLRKKFFFESLQRQVAQLANENEMLKSIVKQRFDSDTKSQVLNECQSELSPVVSASAEKATHHLEKKDFGLMAAIQAAQRSFCITDPSLPDNPIIFASQGFLDLSGYSLNEVLGRNCRFMQGPRTDPSQVEILRNGITNGEDTTVCLLNYKADGTPFYNQIFVAGLRDATHKVINYVGVQVEVKCPPPTVLTSSGAGIASSSKGVPMRSRETKSRKNARLTSTKSTRSQVNLFSHNQSQIPSNSVATAKNPSSASSTNSIRNNYAQLNDNLNVFAQTPNGRGKGAPLTNIPVQYVPGGRTSGQSSVNTSGSSHNSASYSGKP